MPTLVTVPKHAAAGTIVYLFGGPYERLLAGLGGHATLNHLLTAWAERATVVVPAYLGIDRVRAGNGDADRARAEIDVLMIALERRGPVCVIGFSLGGVIAAPGAARHPATGFLLTALLATTPARFVAGAAAQGRAAKPFVLSPVTTNSTMLTLSSDRALLDYFAGSEDRDIAALIGPGPHENVRIVHASGDFAVLRGDLAAIKPMLQCDAIRELPAAIGHSIEAPFAATAYRAVIDRFLSDCLASRKLRVCPLRERS